MRYKLPKPTFWRVVLVLILAAGFYATVLRFARGLGAATNLSDQFPWGIWIGFDVLCGVGLAAGGFTLAAIVFVFHIERFHAVLRHGHITLALLIEYHAVLHPGTAALLHENAQPFAPVIGLGEQRFYLRRRRECQPYNRLINNNFSHISSIAS